MRTLVPFAVFVVVLTGGCGDDASPEEGNGPDHVVLDHILIGVQSSRTLIPRTEDVGRQIAERLMERLKNGESWAKLKDDFSEDPPTKGPPRGGPYEVANKGVSRAHDRERARESLSPAFGDVGFKLAVGEIGLARFHPKTGPFGFHIVKRIR